MLLTVQLLHPYQNPFTIILFRWRIRMKCYHNQRKELFSNKAKSFQEATVAALSAKKMTVVALATPVKLYK